MKYTVNDCHEEIVRLLHILFYGKLDDSEKEDVLKSIKINLENLAKVKRDKMLVAESRKANREARKLGIKR